MHYRILDLTTGEPLDTLALHVLARAYYAAWLAIHDRAPESRHPMPALRVVIDYSGVGTQATRE